MPVYRIHCSIFFKKFLDQVLDCSSAWATVHENTDPQTNHIQTLQNVDYGHLSLDLLWNKFSMSYKLPMKYICAFPCSEMRITQLMKLWWYHIQKL